VPVIVTAKPACVEVVESEVIVGPAADAETAASRTTRKRIILVATICLISLPPIALRRHGKCNDVRFHDGIGLRITSLRLYRIVPGLP